MPAECLGRVASDASPVRCRTARSEGLWLLAPGGGGAADAAAVNAAYRDAEQVVAEAARRSDLLDEARGNAHRVLRAFLASLGWTVEFRDP